MKKKKITQVFERAQGYDFYNFIKLKIQSIFMPLISIIIPVYNCEEFLDETFNCILNQTFKDFEIICVDDGSTDNSLEKLQEFSTKDNRIQIYHQENKGGGIARNFALTKSKGKYVYFMDADDLMELTTLQETYDLIEKTGVDFLFFKALDYDYINNEYIEKPYFLMEKVYEQTGDEVFNYKDIGNYIFDMSATPWGKLYNRQFIIESGAQFGETKAFHDNQFFWKALLVSKKLLFYNKVLYYRRIHSGSIQHNPDKKFLDFIPVISYLVDIFKETGNYDYYETKLINWKISLLNWRLIQIYDEYKDLYFKEYKNQLNIMIDELGYDYLLKMLTPKIKVVFQIVLDANTFREYELLIQINELNNQIKNLKKKNRKLKKQNKELTKKSNDRVFLKN